MEFESWDSSFLFIKCSVITFLPKTPHEAVRNHFPDLASLRIATNPFPTAEKVHHITRHNPILTKNDQHHRPQLPCNGAMHKQVINRLTTRFTHAAPIQNGHPSFSKILRSENFSQSGCPNKKSHPRKDFCFPHTFPRENTRRMRGNKNGVKRTNLKQPPT
jgi:hypothetical protein